MKSFAEKIAVITGGGSGMGRELALQLAVGLANLRGGVEAFAGHGTAFVRTAKAGSNPADLAGPYDPGVKSP